jgi:hypothetical protein
MSNLSEGGGVAGGDDTGNHPERATYGKDS